MGRSKFVFDLLMKTWPLGKVVNWLGSRPLLEPLMRSHFSAEENEAVIIPVEEAVQGTESVVLPYPLLAPLVEQASARFVMNECPCRRGENCQDYTHDVGCLFLGDGAAQINWALGRPVDEDTAMLHVEQATESGLVPLVVHSAFDAWMLGIPYRRTLAICFCCDCCCAIRQGLRIGPPAFWDTVLRLPGLTVVVGPDCVGCGACVEVCHVRAITVEDKDGRAHISELCKGCGRCVATCPSGAIKLHVAENVDVLGHLWAQIEQRTNIRLERERPV